MQDKGLWFTRFDTSHHQGYIPESVQNWQNLGTEMYKCPQSHLKIQAFFLEGMLITGFL